MSDLLTKAAGNEHDAMLLHGPGGMFNTPGLENPFITTVIKPKGIGALLPAFASTSTHPWYGLVTELVDDGDSEPDYVCSDAPTASMKSGVLSSTFGRVQTATDTIDLGTLALKLNDADRTDLQLLGGLLPQDQAGVGYSQGISEDNVLNSAIRAEMVSASWLMSMKLNKMVWNGNPANASTNGGYTPFNGLERLIKTGIVDAETNDAIAPADSLVIDGGFGEVGNGFEIAQTLRNVLAYLEDLADSTVDGATFIIVMRPNMWQLVSDVWSLLYVNELTTQVSTSTASQLMLDASNLTSIRDALKASMMLPIGGKTYPVFVDHGITEQDNGDDAVNIPAGSYASSIYVLPLTVGPGMPVLYWEYLDWAAATAMLGDSNILNAMAFWTDGGRFAWTLDQNKLCIKLQCRTEPRLTLRTPQLCARIDDLLYTPSILHRQPHSGDAGHVAGGVATRTGPTKYGP